MKSLKYLLHNGKNSNFTYYLRGVAGLALPPKLFRRRLAEALDSIDLREDSDYIHSRVEYYNRLSAGVSPLPPDAPRLADHSLFRRNYASPYFFDSYEYTRWFDPQLRWCTRFGDVTEVPPVPSIVKSRPIADDDSNARSVLLNLDKNRHFVFLHDRLQFEAKSDRAIFRGHIKHKPNRELFIRKFIDNPRFDVGEMTGNPNYPASWHKPKITLYDHLRYKYIMALEGKDVASNLKWIMSSNSLAVTPRPVYETWFMEGTLKPDYHYVEIRPDFADLEEKMDYFTAHPDKAREISDNAHRFISQFLNPERERLISLAVLEKYFKLLG